jgi:hypothetical protein
MLKPKYEVIDNFTEDYTNDHIHNIISSKTFPWYLSNKVGKSKELWDFQFYHMIYYYRDHYKSNYYSLIESLLKKLDIGVLLKIKINCTTYTKEILKYPLHTDFNIKAKTCIYYVNDNNGYTYFNDGSKVYSKARRLVKFDSKHMHSGTTSTDSKHRFVININYIPTEVITYDKEI